MIYINYYRKINSLNIYINYNFNNNKAANKDYQYIKQLLNGIFKLDIKDY